MNKVMQLSNTKGSTQDSILLTLSTKNGVEPDILLHHSDDVGTFANGVRIYYKDENLHVQSVKVTETINTHYMPSNWLTYPF